MGLFGLFGGTKSNPADSMPQNDAERWITGIYALWSEYCGGSYKFFGGYEKNRSNASMVRGVLNGDWLVTNKQGVLEMVDYLIDDKTMRVRRRKNPHLIMVVRQISLPEVIWVVTSPEKK